MIEVEKYEKQADIAYILYDILVEVYTISPWTVRQLEEDLIQSDTVYYLAKRGRDVIGFLAVQQLVDELEILHIAVRKDFQGQGIAKRLLECIEQFSGSVFLEVRVSNHRAKCLYEGLGFVEIGRRKDYYHAPREDAIVMKREKDER